MNRVEYQNFKGFIRPQSDFSLLNFIGYIIIFIITIWTIDSIFDVCLITLSEKFYYFAGCMEFKYKGFPQRNEKLQKC